MRMPRPRNPVGTYGVINVAEVEPGKFRARTRYRFNDGRNRQVERFAPSKAKAEAKLRAALKAIEAENGGSLRGGTNLRELAHRFLKEKEESGRSGGTIETYGYAVSAHIVPKLGEMTALEATPERLQSFLTKVEKEHGPGAAKNCRSVLSGMLGMAVRNGAIQRNPVRELERITHRTKKGSEAIPLAELPTFLERVRADELLQEWDTVELIEFMLSVGWRVAEACGLEWSAVDFKAKTAAMTGIAKRLPKVGMVRQAFGKTDASYRVTPLPDQALRLLERRHARDRSDGGLVFATPLGRMRDPSNTQREIRDRREALGYPALTTHSFRKTVATILDDAGMSARDIAEFLGQKNPSITQDVYMAKKTGSAKAAQAMGSALGGLF